MQPEAELDLSPIVRKRAHEEVIERIQKEILDGRLKPGDRLPGERELSQRLGVSRAAVREGLRVLEWMEVLHPRTGAGPSSGSILTQGAGEVLGNLLLLQTALDRFSLSELVPLRSLLEGYGVAEAARQRTDADLEELEATVAEMESVPLPPTEFMKLDSTFHIALARASGNRLCHYLMRSLRQVIEHVLTEIFESVEDWEATREAMTREHRNVLEAVREGNADAAAQLVREHITKSYERAR